MKLADPRPLFLLLSFCWMAAVQPAQGQVTRPLTAGESRCEAKRMYAATVQSWGWPRNLHLSEAREARLTFSPAGPAGGIQGVAYLDQFSQFLGDLASTPEELLWFTLGQTAPNRPQNVRLARTAETVLVEPDALDMAFFYGSFEAAVAGDRSALLDVDNIELPEGVAADTKRLPQLAEALRPCHAKHTAADLRVFNLLQRIVRVQTHPGHPNFYLQSHKMVIYRGRTAEPIAGGGVRTAYRIDVYPFHSQYRFALEILVDIDAQGRPGNATAYPLRDCNSPEQVHCNYQWADAYFIKPAAPGQFYDIDQALGFCVGDFCTNRGSFNFAERLAGTPWELD